VAGERKGISYEAMVKVCLDTIVEEGVLKGSVFWNERPESMSIEPDFTIGPDKDRPTHLFLVTHSGSAKDSEKKFWRNIGELVEAKSRLQAPPLVISVVFDSVVKADLKLIQDTAFDAQLVVGDRPYGVELLKWVQQQSSGLPKRGGEKAEALCESMRSAGGKVLSLQMRRLVSDFRRLLASLAPKHSSLWRLARARTVPPAPAARDTFVRRGLIKAALLGAMPTRRLTVTPSAAALALELSISRKDDMARASLSGPRLADRDLIWLAGSSLQSVDVASLVEKYATDGFRRQIDKVRSVGILPVLIRYVAGNLDQLKTHKGMLRTLRALHEDPSDGLELDPTLTAPTTIWLFDVVGAIIKAKTNKAQDFGYSTFAKHPECGASKVGNMPIGTWASCFMNQYFNRQADFRAPAAAVEYCAKVLAGVLSSCSRPEIEKAREDIRQQYVRKELEVGLLTHRGFDPVRALLLDELQNVGLRAKELTVQSAFAERAMSEGSEIDGRSSATSLLKANSAYLCWQSAHDSHTNDKKKELCGRVAGLRHHWNGTSFVRRPGVDQLVLVLDGTWKDDDIRALLQSGWDDIYYPDEMDRVVKKIS